MTTSIATLNSDQDMNVQLRDLVAPLGFAKHHNLRERFKTFVKKTYAVDVEDFTDWKLIGCFPSDYFDSVTLQFVRTYAMSTEKATLLNKNNQLSDALAYDVFQAK